MKKGRIPGGVLPFYRGKLILSHFSGHVSGDENQDNGDHCQHGGADVSHHVGAGGVVEAGGNLRSHKGADSVADEDQAVVPVVVFGTEDDLDHGCEHHQESSEGEAYQGDAQDKIGIGICHSQHKHGQAVDDQNQNQGVPALKPVIDKAKGDAAEHVEQGHKADAEGSGHGGQADLVLGDGGGGADHHGAGGVGKDEHDQQNPENRLLDHLGNVVVFRVQLLALGLGRHPSLRRPAVGTGNDHPRHSAHADEEHNAQDDTGLLSSEVVNEHLSDGGHDERSAGGSRLNQSGDGTALVREPFQGSGQAGGIDGSRAGPGDDSVGDVEERDGIGKSGEDPSAGKQDQADVDGHPGLQLFSQNASEKAYGAVDKHIYGIGHGKIRAAPAELIAHGQGEQAEESGGRGKKTLNPYTRKDAPAGRFCDFHFIHLPCDQLLQSSQVQGHFTAVEFARFPAGSHPVNHG